MPAALPAPTFADDLPHRTAYVDMGEGAAMLLIHGSLCDYRYWRWQLPALSAEFRVVAPSLRGYWPDTASHPDARFSVLQHRDDMIAFMHRIGRGKPVHVVGHSRGAHVALEIAMAAAPLVQSLTLADPGFRASEEDAAPSVLRHAAELIGQGRTDEALAGFIDAVSGANTWRSTVSWFKDMLRDNARTLMSQVHDTATVDLQAVPALGMPVLLVGGADSPARFGRCLDTLEHLLPHAARVSIPLASHGMNLANPKAFNAALLDFVQRQCA